MSPAYFAHVPKQPTYSMADIRSILVGEMPTCDLCGALVGNRAAHDRWHNPGAPKPVPGYLQPCPKPDCDYDGHHYHTHRGETKGHEMHQWHDIGHTDCYTTATSARKDAR